MVLADGSQLMTIGAKLNTKYPHGVTEQLSGGEIGTLKVNKVDGVVPASYRKPFVLWAECLGDYPALKSQQMAHGLQFFRGFYLPHLSRLTEGAGREELTVVAECDHKDPVL